MCVAVQTYEEERFSLVLQIEKQPVEQRKRHLPVSMPENTQVAETSSLARMRGRGKAITELSPYRRLTQTP
jgi:hypothetical protein